MNRNQTGKLAIQANELKSSIDVDKSIDKLTNQTASSPNVQFKKLSSINLIDEQLLTSFYIVCSFLICVHILIHYCFARQDVREALKSMIIKTFCLYACDCCFKRCFKRRCCNQMNW